jgi:cysteine-rich repeat protein
MRWAIVVSCLLVSVPVCGLCTGDCDGDGAVSVGEIVQGVNIALLAAPLSSCEAMDASHDGVLTIDELVRSVDAALHGCCGDGVTNGDEECDDGNLADGDGCTASCELEPGGDVCAGVKGKPGMDVAAVRVAEGLTSPLYVTSPPLDPARAFILEQKGTVRILKSGQLLPTPFLDIRDRVDCCGERGLLGLAFHPDYERNGRFFVDYTNRDGDTVIARYGVGPDPDQADAASEKILLRIDQPFSNHNGGQVAFGPDGFLYVGMGDGGAENDPRNRAQSDDTLLGKLLRLDVDVDEPPYYAIPSDNPAAERGRLFGSIWAKGLRNPFRFSFDRATGDLYIGDVGQDEFEEVDVQPAASGGGENYGWRIFEGDTCFEPAPLPECPDPALAGITQPVLVYDHSDGCSITGGYVYRGCALPDLRGTYFYGDFCSAIVRSFVLDGNRATEQRDWTADLHLAEGSDIYSISSFGEDARGELYIVDYDDGEVFKLEPYGG